MHERTHAGEEEEEEEDRASAATTPCKVTPVILHGVVSPHRSSYTGLYPQKGEHGGEEEEEDRASTARASAAARSLQTHDRWDHASTAAPGAVVRQGAVVRRAAVRPAPGAVPAEEAGVMGLAPRPREEGAEEAEEEGDHASAQTHDPSDHASAVIVAQDGSARTRACAGCVALLDPTPET